VADGAIRADAPLPLVRRMLIGSLEEIELEWLIGDRSRPLVRTAGLLADTLVRGLAPEPRTR
jgi:TetR/AcrR family transcriptional regulator, fatty acid metabolism regulator protein